MRALLLLAFIASALLLGGILAGLRSDPGLVSCHPDVPRFNALRYESRQARQAGEHDKATALDYAAAELTCER